QEPTIWYDQIKKRFEGQMAPRMTPVIVHVDNQAVMALLFETTQPPYLVANPKFGREHGEVISYEVPWRENTSVRSATHADLVRLLVPLRHLPQIRILSANL